MNSFTLTAVGNLARNPEQVAKGDLTYARFCLVGTDYLGKDEIGAPREMSTSLWFVAFGALGEALVRNSRKGDQLIVEARVRGNVWTDKQGERQYDHDFVVQGFRFGAPGRAKRDELNGRELAARREAEPAGATEIASSSGGNGTGVEEAPMVAERNTGAASSAAVKRSVVQEQSKTTAENTADAIGEKPFDVKVGAEKSGVEKPSIDKAAPEKPRGGRKINASSH